MNRLQQQQLNYLSYSQLWDLKNIDADYQYNNWKKQNVKKDVVEHKK